MLPVLNIFIKLLPDLDQPIISSAASCFQTVLPLAIRKANIDLILDIVTSCFVVTGVDPETYSRGKSLFELVLSEGRNTIGSAGLAARKKVSCTETNVLTLLMHF